VKGRSRGRCYTTGTNRDVLEGLSKTTDIRSLGPRLEPGHLRIQNRSYNHSVARFGQTSRICKILT
jgi:hypothetical protein